MAKRLKGVSEGPEDGTEAAISMEAFVLEAFMIEMMREFAWRERDRAGWVRQFIDRLHARIDRPPSDEPLDGWEAVHEAARRAVDDAGSLLLDELRQG